MVLEMGGGGGGGGGQDPLILECDGLLVLKNNEKWKLIP